MSLLCPTCGAAAAVGDRFCEGCGADLPIIDSGDAAPPTPAEVLPFDDADSDAAFAADIAVVDAPARPCTSCGAAGDQIMDGYCGVCGMKQPAARDHVEVTLDGAAAVTDRGRKHYRNEDAFALDVTDGRVIAVVCDGVSSTVDPDQASQAAADAALGALIATVAKDENTDAADGLMEAHAAAQAAVAAIDATPQPPDLGLPSCTFLATVVDAGVVDTATLGDCRTFWLPMDGSAEVLTEDDSWAAEQIAAGTLTPGEAYDNPLAHTITRWLGRDADPSWRPRLVRFPVPGPGRLVLCSDGLWNYAESGTEVANAAGADDPITVAQRLVAFANDKGGHDNITVVIIDVDTDIAAPNPVPVAETGSSSPRFEHENAGTDRKDSPDGTSD